MSIAAFVGSDLYLCLGSVAATFLAQGVLLIITGGESMEFEQRGGEKQEPGCSLLHRAGPVT